MTSITNNQLRAFIERVEKLEAEKKAVGEDIKSIYAEAKGSGYDSKILRKIVRLRAMPEDARREEQALLETYMEALQMEMDL